MRRIPANAIVLSVFVVAVVALVLSAPAIDDRALALRLGLREVVSTVEASRAVSSELALDVEHAVSRVVDEAPATDETWVAAAAVLVAYGLDEPAREWLGHVADPGPEAQLLARLARQPDAAPPDAAAPDATPPVDGAATGGEGAAPVPGGPAALTADDVAHDLETIRGMADVPRLARERLAVRLLREAGEEARAEQTEAALHRERDADMLRLGLVLGALALSGLVGIGLWLFSRRIRAYLRRRFHGLLPDPPFAIEGHVLYTAVVGWFAFHLAVGILLPLALAPTGLLEGEPALAIALSTTATGLFGLVIAQRLVGPASLLPALGVHVAPFRGGVLQAGVWGWLFYCASIPAWMSAQVLNASLVPDDTVVSSPVIPLLADTGSPAGLALLALAVAVLAPLFEEAFFRGFLYRALRERLGVSGAVLASSAVFALVHLSFQTVLPLFALGCILALAYEWTGSLVPSIVLHSLNNAVSMALVLATLSG